MKSENFIGKKKHKRRTFTNKEGEMAKFSTSARQKFADGRKTTHRTHKIKQR